MLFCSKCFDGTYVGSLAGGHQSCQRIGNNHDECGFDADVESHRWVYEHRCLKKSRAHLLMTDGRIHLEVRANTQKHADITEEGGDEHTFDDDQAQDGIGRGTDSLADAKLAGSFLHGDEHDVRHTHDA